MLEMVDYYGGTVLILSLASVEVIAINWIYGTSTLTRDFNFMLNTQLSLYWRFCWGILCPILLPLLFLYVLFTQAGVPAIPLPAQIAGWVVAAIGKSNYVSSFNVRSICPSARNAAGADSRATLRVWRHRDGVRHFPQQSLRHLQRRQSRGQDQVRLHAKQPVGARQHPGEEGLADLLRGDLPLPLAPQVHQEEVEISTFIPKWVQYSLKVQ